MDEATTPKPSRRLEAILGSLIALILLGLGGLYAAGYVLSPTAIRHPAHAHFHFRIIVVNGGTAVNFADDAFQTDYSKDVCSAALTKQPMHFHDHNSQYGHIHWAGMTGGLLLKNYGWNFIGGLSGALGYRFDKGVLPSRVPIHGNALPARASNMNYYIYTGTATDHAARSWSDFLGQPLDTFLAGTKVLDAAETPQLLAQDMNAAQMNDVVGNVVIFAQKSSPTPDEVTTKFKEFKPLPDSPCEG